MLSISQKHDTTESKHTRRQQTQTNSHDHQKPVANPPKQTKKKTTTKMTEFNTSGFDVVDKFFGTTEDDAAAGGGADATTVKHGGGQDSTKNNNRHNRSRGGVGHSKTSSHSSADKANEALRTTLLKVGRKQRSANGTIDDDDHEDNKGDHYHQDDPDEDFGRTAIASDRSMNNEDNRGKKKLGKKERMKLKKVEEQQKNGMTKDTTSTSQREINQGENKHQLEGQDSVSGEQQEHNKQHQQVQKKKKRRKVRSRQKNIYKDKRSMDEKPSHLVPGSRDYAGRPMTHATRKRLNLPENPQPAATKRSKIGNYQHSTPHSKIDGDSVDDLFVIDRQPSSSTVGVDDMLVGEKLAVDDLQSSDDEEDGHDDGNDQGEVIIVGDSSCSGTVQQNCEKNDNRNLPSIKSDNNREMKKEKKKKRKKTKKRFKNLM